MPHNQEFEVPIREEMFGLERLEEYAQYLATELPVSRKKQRGRSLLPRLEENYQCLVKTYKALTDAAQRGATITPAGEWLVDNFHIIDDQVREVREDLPEQYYRELPKITKGGLINYPRVYGIALTLIAHQDSHIDIETVKKFLRSYQKSSPLLIGEVWAMAIAIRIALIENLRRLSNQIIHFQEIQEWADRCAEQIFTAANTSSEALQEIVIELSHELKKSDLSDCSLIVQLSKRLRDQSLNVLPVCECLDQYLTGRNLNIDQIVHIEYQRQAASQVTVSNIVNSMRLLSNLDWQEFFESVNLIDPILDADPALAYKIMDFSSRDRYRHAIERIQKKTGVSEIFIAKDVLFLAQNAFDSQVEDQRQYHVGYYLIGDGVRILEKRIGYRASLFEQFKYFILDHPTAFYLLTLLSMVSAILAPILFYADEQAAPIWSLIFIALAAVIPISDSCLNLLNLFVSRLISPRVLPKIDLEKDGDNIENAFVIVPTIFATISQASKALDGLEIRYLSNQDDNLYFALLSDFTDSHFESTDYDSKLLDFVKEGIDELNRKYPNQQEKFYLFHRKRLWNEKEKKWMGGERKRGKIHEFNRFLRGASDTSFIVAPTFNNFFAQINYVITLDSDTRLPRGSATKLLGTILHPLNQPQFDPKTGRVTRGYGILQPRISITPESSERSWFAKIFSGHTGIDPYTTAVSDVYQDLFGEGIYTGKGLYVVDSFEKALAGRVPENALLSHDLFEGLFARTALVTEIEFLDDYPSNYEVFTKRQHRWSRGDWQILGWLMPFVSNAKGSMVANHLPFISRWKIFDNLRRSLVSFTMLLWLILGWTILPGPAAIWTAITLVVLGFPFYAHVTNNLLLHPRGIPWSRHLGNVWDGVGTNSVQLILSILCIPHQALIHMDAIIRTLYRLKVKKNLLEWQTAADVEENFLQKNNFSLPLFLTPMTTAIGVFFLLLYRDVAVIPFALPFLVGWFFFPIIIKYMSRPRIKKMVHLDLPEIDLMREIARKTWNFFETFMSDQDHWLPPDNFQENPKPLIAHRTSPTNMGLALLATCSAYNLGHIGSLEMISRLRRTLTTMLKLKRHFGHFYNWYDTQTLQPLLPEYISTVDSGNLAGHLIAVKQSCLAMIGTPIFSGHYFKGLKDTLRIIENKLKKLNLEFQEKSIFDSAILRTQMSECIKLCGLEMGQSLTNFRRMLNAIHEHLKNIEQITQSTNEKEMQDEFQNIKQWIGICSKTIESYGKELDLFFPWNEQTLTKLGQLLQEHDVLTYSKLQILLVSLDSAKAVDEHQILCKKISHALASSTLIKSDNFLSEFYQTLNRVIDHCDKFKRDCEELADLCHDLALNMDFKILFNQQRKLFSIGKNIKDGKLDNSFYDLFASESRLASFIAIAKGDVPQSHWFHLGRQMTSVYKQRVLISWSASMFEYMMPLLVMKEYPDTLLDETYAAVIKQQMIYGKDRGIPWGISESGYNARDLQMNYQYGPFGVPGMGLKRGLSDDTVISPYSTALAALISPRDACKNFKHLIRENLLTDFGLYESIDYTKERVQPGQFQNVIHSFMIHHQGMILTALDNVLNNNILQNRFHDDLLIRSSELLLQERAPKRVSISHPRSEEIQVKKNEVSQKEPNLRHINYVDTTYPITQVLSNSNYSVMLSAAGSGYSKREKLALSRWNEDALRDLQGNYIFIEDDQSQSSWSASFRPMNIEPEVYNTIFSEHKAEFWCHKNKLVTHTEVIVSSENDVELRRITLTNFSKEERTVTVTSYLEPILTTPEADLAHPAFSNLFIETEHIPTKLALLAHRRQRAASDPDVWAMHLLNCKAELTGTYQFETNRENFIGRGRNISTPIVIDKNSALTNTVGAVLDPIFSIRKQVKLAPQASVQLCFVSGVTNSREEAFKLIDRYHDPHVFDREDEMAWIKCQAELMHLNITYKEAEYYQILGNNLLYFGGQLKARLNQSLITTKSQSALWAYGISGDLPILLVEIKNEHEINLIRELLHGHEYLRLKGIRYDMVIINAKANSYRLALHEELIHEVKMSGQAGLLNKPGGIFILRNDAVPLDDLVLLQTIARVYLNCESGSLKEQVLRLSLRKEILKNDLQKKLTPYSPSTKHTAIPLIIPKRQFENGLGGFSTDGSEYIIHLNSDQSTPRPWCNVIANEKEFGFLVSERGSTYTWSQNSRENRITPWSNDPICDPSGEIFYIRDLDSNEKWSPTPGPLKGSGPYLIRHGQGHSHFENNNFEIRQRLSMFCATDEEVKINRLTLKNDSDHKRRLSVFYYVELVLGFHRTRGIPHITTKKGQAQNIFLAKNNYNDDFKDRITFVAVSEAVSTFTCDRKNFLGPQGSYTNPQGLDAARLNQVSGRGLDPCFTIRVDIELKPQEEKDIVFLLGQNSSEDQIYKVAHNILQKNGVHQELLRVNNFWDNILNVIQVKTPFPEFDILINRWLLYQNLSCRVWARSAFYQSGGAFGFRDQLQDVLALLHTSPHVARQQIILAASRQFKEGDVQHWWHPPSNKGVRTHFSDDLLWLPFVVAKYILVTNEISLLDETVPFIEGPELLPDQEDQYFAPTVSESSGSVYEHCLKAIDRSLKLGAHGLPLMGTGDWNDGMNLVGEKGQGESVWMAWFLISILPSFIKICEQKNDYDRVDIYQKHLQKLKDAVETTGWDGEWYKRAYFDDGNPLGSKENDECKIDSLTQSWAALSGSANPEHLKMALASLNKYLVNEEDQLILLFTPPFDKTALNPGYVKGYLPGIRENGAQYTHAAVWAAMAFAAHQDGDKALKLMSIMNPILHSSTPKKSQLYKVEPYVISADVYSNPSHKGMGGWSWYTGSAGWYYRAFTESILGISREGNTLRIKPCLPKALAQYKIKYKFGSSLYEININCKMGRSDEVGQNTDSTLIALKDDGKVHNVNIEIFFSI